MSAWNKIVIPKSRIEELYTIRKFSISHIAQLLNCSTNPVHRSLREYKIPIRNLSQACTKFPVSKKVLRKWYLKDKLSMSEVADKLGCTHATIVYKFKKFGIKSRGHLGLVKPLRVSKQGLEYLYYERRLSFKKIAKIVHRSKGGLERRFKKYGLSSRGIKNRVCKYKE